MRKLCKELLAHLKYAYSTLYDKYLLQRTSTCVQVDGWGVYAEGRQTVTAQRIEKKFKFYRCQQKKFITNPSNNNSTQQEEYFEQDLSARREALTSYANTSFMGWDKGLTLIFSVGLQTPNSWQEMA